MLLEVGARTRPAAPFVALHRLVALLSIPFVACALASCGRDRVDPASQPPPAPPPTDSGGPAPGRDRELSAARAPNEVRYLGTGETTVPRASLAPGREIGPGLDVSVARYVGAYGVDGRTLADYVAIGSLGASARLYVRVKNTTGLELRVERRSVATAGRWLALEGTQGAAIALPPFPNDDAWHWASVVVATDQLALARRKGVPEVNAFRVVVSALSSETIAPVNVGVSAVAVDFFAQAPVVLVHGINDNQESCWSDYAPLLESVGFVADAAVTFAGLGDKPGLAGGPPTFNGSVSDNVLRIEERLLRIGPDYGTSDVNLVAHSKGGLDVVNFLATRYAAHKAQRALRVLTLQTLATPHAGSVAADILQPLKAWAAAKGYAQTSDWASWGVVAGPTTDDAVLDTLALTAIKASVINGSGPIDPGLSDLRTSSAAVAADLAWSGDPDVHFATYGFDADFEPMRWLDLAGQLTTPPAPGDLFAKYSTDCRGSPVGSTRWTYYCIDEDEVDTFFWGTTAYPPLGTICSGWNQCGSTLYRQLARGTNAKVVSGPLLGGTRSTIAMESRETGVWDGNDLVVALSSAAHPRAERNARLAGAAPRSIPNQRRFDAGGGVSSYNATCLHAGANHIAILRRSRANMVECTVADTADWIRAKAPVVAVPVDARAQP